MDLPAMSCLPLPGTPGPDKVMVCRAVAKSIAGAPVDLQALAKTVESRIAGDAYNDGKCPDIKVPDTELAPT